MASILRSSKFVRYFAGFARNAVFNTVRETEGSFIQQSQCLCSNSISGFATSAASSSQGLDRSLKRLDEDVRRSGRISRRDLEDVLEEIRVNRSATSAQSLLVIRCCGNLVPEELPEVRTALVQEIWKTLDSLNVAMDISHYNALLRVFLDNEHPFSPTEFLADLKAKGVEPNRVTYQRLISRYCQEGDIEGATKILEHMREKQLPVNEYVFNALIMGHSQADDLESATGILAVMSQAGLQPSADTYTTLLCGYARKGDIDYILKTLETCEQKEIFLLDKDVLEIIYFLATNGFAEKVDPLVEKIRKQAGYNQDAVNVILRLINKGQEEVGLKLLKTMPRATRTDGELANTGGFLIKQLVKAKRPVDKVLGICNELQDAGLNNNASLIALETALKNGILEMAYPLLKALHGQNFPIRQHYFWPLLCSNEQQRPEGVLNVLKTMLEDFNIQPSGETIREYAIPNIGMNNNDEVIQLLRSVGISTAVASSGCAYVSLEKNDLKEAANIASRYRAFYSPGVFRKTLVSALVQSKDFDSYIRFSRYLYDNLLRHNSKDEVSDETGETDSLQNLQAEVLGSMVYDVLVSFKNKRVEALEKVLTGFVNQGLSISNSQAEKIQEKLGAEMTTEISAMLSKLAAGDLEPIQLDATSPRLKSLNSTLSVPQLERLVTDLQTRGENTNALKNQLIRNAIRANDVSKTEEILLRLEEESYVVQPGVYAQVIELYANNGKLEEAFNLLNRVKAKLPDFELDDTKIIKLAQAIMNQDRFEDTLKFLDENKPAVGRDDKSVDFNYNSACWRLLNMQAEKGNVNEVNKLFTYLLGNGYITPHNIFLGSLIKVHMVNDDLKSAITVFEEICQKYRTTPWKTELTCRLIQSEDASNLQRITDLSTEVHGEVNSLYDLVFAFVDCGRIRQARKILETPGLRTRYQRIQNACERYHVEGKTQSLEGLMEATKDLNHIDRSDIYYKLLKSYINEQHPEKALGLWTKMQEENETPTDSFLTELANFLKANGYEVPFATPAAKTQAVPKKVAKLQDKSKPVPTKPKTTEPKKEALTLTLRNFKAAVKMSDPDRILEARDKLVQTDKLNLTEQSVIIEALINRDRLNDASKLVLELLEQNLHPIPRIFKYFLNKLAVSGDLSTFERINGHLTDDVKRMVSFDNRYCHVNLASGNVEQYLKKLEDTIDSVKTKEDAEKVAKHFPIGGASGILSQHPELHDRYQSLAERYVTWDIIAPINALWTHHFMVGNDEQAKQVWDKYLANSSRVMFQKVIQHARENNDDVLVRRLIEQMKDSKVSENGMGIMYSCLIDALITKGHVEPALDALKEALKAICLEHINRSALRRLKDGLSATGKDFPYTIPERKVNKAHDTSSSSSSSSSSDDDIGKTSK